MERAFEDCYAESDWLCPDGEKSWASEVKWELCQRHDLRSHSLRSARVAAVDEEARQAMERDASFYKWYAKAAQAPKAGVDQ